MTAAMHMNIISVVELCAEWGDSSHDGSSEWECGDCDKADSAWSQCEHNQQGNCTPCLVYINPCTLHWYVTGGHSQ